MSRISEVFAGARRRGEAVLIPYITAGYPDVATNERIILELFRSGAGVVELGIPFSDPLADGPTIQRAGTAALAMGVTMSTCLEIAGRVHSQVDSPIILMGYFNTILSYGIEKFTAGASAAGVAGVIVPDLPPEEAGDLREVCSRQGIDLVFLLAPASTDERVQLVASQSAGFVYCVSVAGVTGARAEMPAGLEDFVERVRGRANLPLAVGFGISTPAQARTVARIADGVIVGSALIDLVDSLEGEARISGVRDFVRGLKEACKANEMQGH